MQRARGFTLIEIMVVMAIIAILATLVVPNLMDRPEQARRIKAQQDLQAIDNALSLYRLDNGRLPTQEQGLEALVRPASIPPVPHHWPKHGYLRQLPQDPWGRTYQYLNPGETGEYDLFSLGPDGHDALYQQAQPVSAQQHYTQRH